MQIKQFEDKNLSHYSYAIVSDCEGKIVVIDPSRDPQPYLDFAKDAGVQITGIVETHPHADFVSGHLELHHLTGATIYVSKLVQALYPHQTFDEGDHIQIGKIKLSAINTPGHSPDSICILLVHDDRQKAVFTGDTLFIGDCGRPDLREGSDELQTKRKELAKQMYHSLRDKLMVLNDDVVVYPAHGAGTLCGKNLSKESSSTLGEQKQTNWSLQEATEDEFVKNLLEDQPFIPAYFAYNVGLNQKGTGPLQEGIEAITILVEADNETLDNTYWIIDTRNEKDFKDGHLPRSINLMEKGKFETWLGSIIEPEEKFYLAGENKDQIKRMLKRVASIGYETAVEKALVLKGGALQQPKLDIKLFKENMDAYTILDVRNESEVKEGKIFAESISIPLAELRQRSNEIPTNKPVVVHCGGGYRSAAGSSLLLSILGDAVKVFDLGDAVKEFK